MSTTNLRPSELGTGASSGEHGIAVGPGRTDGMNGNGQQLDGQRLDASWATENRPEAVESRAAITGHPIHPMLVPLPIGALVGVALSDIAYVRTNDPFWARSARHLTDAAIIAATVAAIPGMVDFTSREQIRERPEAWVHAAGNVTVLGLAILSRTIRSRDERSAAAGPGLAISGLSAAILGITGWLGGELSYRHRIGVTRQ
jgi:uncharacterized membrane protein